MLKLARYYAANAYQSRIKNPLNKRAVAKAETAWQQLRQSAPKSDAMLVVCNGPSLAATDLERLAAIPAIASNKVALMFDRTDWRPRYYTIADPLLAFKLRDDPFAAHPQVLCSHNIRSFFRRVTPLPWLNIMYHQADNRALSGEFTPDPVKGFIDGYTITVHNIQLALWLGARRIYLIGCDHSYAEERQARVAKLVHGDQANHFDPRYRAKGEIVNNAPIERMELAFEAIRRIAEFNQAQIINISRRTALDIFERKSADDIIAEVGTP